MGLLMCGLEVVEAINEKAHRARRWILRRLFARTRDRAPGPDTVERVSSRGTIKFGDFKLDTAIRTAVARSGPLSSEVSVLGSTDEPGKLLRQQVGSEKVWE
jgi:hypothetical protein